MIAKTSTIVKTDGFIEREIGDEIIFFADSGAEIHTIDGTGLYIYKSIDGATTVTSIVAKVCSEYEVDEPTAEADTTAFLSQLLDKGIIALAG